MQGKLYVRNWAKFQHYKRRRPPWIRLYLDTFENYEFCQLTEYARLLLMGIWTLAARSHDGSTTFDLSWIKEQLTFGKVIQKCHLDELLKHGFLSTNASIERQLASKVLARCRKYSSPETETETESKNISVVAVIPESKINTSPNIKAQAPFLIPDWIPQPQWNDFLEMRKRIRKPMTNRGKQLLVAKLEKLGSDTAAILEQSILNDWQSVWPLQEQNNGRYRGAKAKLTIPELVELSKRKPDFGQGDF